VTIKNAARGDVFFTNQAGLLADFSPGITKTYGAVEYQFIRSSMAAVEAEVTFTLKLVRFPHLQRP
jgi:hypothetical protein